MPCFLSYKKCTLSTYIKLFEKDLQGKLEKNTDSFDRDSSVNEPILSQLLSYNFNVIMAAE